MRFDKDYLKILMKNVVENDDEKSFSKLFVLLYDRLVDFSATYVASKELAEEIVSDVLLKIWNNRKRFEILDIEAYLFISVRNQSLNALGKRSLSSIKVSASSDFELHNLMDVFDPQKELEASELEYSIRLAVDTLPPQCKRVYTLIKEEGFKYKEVSNILGVSVRTVETQLVRALKKLDHALTPYIVKRSKADKITGTPSVDGVILIFFPLILTLL